MIQIIMEHEITCIGDLAAAISRSRTDQRLTTGEVAGRAGLTTDVVTRLETGDPDVTIGQLFAVLGALQLTGGLTGHSRAERMAVYDRMRTDEDAYYPDLEFGEPSVPRSNPSKTRNSNQ